MTEANETPGLFVDAQHHLGGDCHAHESDPLERDISRIVCRWSGKDGDARLQDCENDEENEVKRGYQPERSERPTGSSSRWCAGQALVRALDAERDGVTAAEAKCREPFLRAALLHRVEQRR